MEPGGITYPITGMFIIPKNCHKRHLRPLPTDRFPRGPRGGSLCDEIQANKFERVGGGLYGEFQVNKCGLVGGPGPGWAGSLYGEGSGSMSPETDLRQTSINDQQLIPIK